MAKAEDNQFPYWQATENYLPGTPPAGDAIRRHYVDATDHVLKDVDEDGNVSPHWPVLLVENGASVPAGTAAGTLIFEKGL